MKHITRTALAVIMLTVGFIAQAQTDESMIDPNNIFVEGVIWTRIETDTSPQARVDFQNRVIAVFDGDEWHSFPYPPNVDSVGDATLRPDGMVVVMLSRLGDNMRPENVWLLDPQTSTYVHPPMVCEGNVIKAMPGETGEWVIGHNSEDTFLCHSGTGQIRDVLPNGLDAWRLFPSPNGHYFVLTAMDWNSDGDFLVFAYRLDADELSLLGKASRDLDRTVHMCGWVSNTQGALCAPDTYRSWPGTTYYAFDVTQADSLVLAFNGWRANTFQIDNPSRYVSLFSQNYAASIMGGSGPDHIPCTLTVYDAEQLLDLEFGYECLILSSGPFEMETAPYYRHGDTIYYVTVQSETATVATLYSYDARTLTQHQIFTGDIQNILSVSPDGRYIVLLMGKYGGTPGNFSVAIMHVEDGMFHRFVYPVYSTDQIVW